MNDFKRAVVVSVTALCEAFGKVASEATFQAYEWGLEGLSPSDVQMATRDALQSSRFMPSPAELRELAASCGETAGVRALKAFLAVERAAQQHGGDKTVAFDDPLINAAINLCGGWLRFCEATVHEFDTWLRKEFLAVYAGLVRKPPGPDLCQPSPGRYFRANGFFHEHDKLLEVASGLTLGPVQQQLADARELLRIEERPADVPRVEFKNPNAAGFLPEPNPTEATT